MGQYPDRWQIWDGGIPCCLARHLWIDPRDPDDPNDDILFVSSGQVSDLGLGAFES